MTKPYTEKLRERLQEFADSIVWSNDVGDEKYLGVGNMADWIVTQHTQFVEELERAIDANVVDMDIFEDDPPKIRERLAEVYNKALEDIKHHIKNL